MLQLARAANMQHGMGFKLNLERSMIK